YSAFALPHRGSQCGAAAEDPPVLHDLPGAVEAERADDAAATTEQRDELPLGVGAVRYVEIRFGRHHADGLDLAVVLVGPHERHRREREIGARVAGEEAPRRVN